MSRGRIVLLVDLPGDRYCPNQASVLALGNEFRRLVAYLGSESSTSPFSLRAVQEPTLSPSPESIHILCSSIA